MAKEKKSNTPANHAGRPTGSYSSYGTSGYGAPYGGGYGSAGNGAYSRSTYGANNAQPTTPNANNDAQATGKGKKKAEKVNTANMSGKQKKLAKRQAKFDENDLRNYPMKVRNWIGTFILLAIPFVNVICGICWFFGVGNRSRTSWIRSYIVICLLVVLIFGLIFGVGYGVLTKNAKDSSVEIDGVSYGTCGDYGIKGTVYYLLCSFIDTPMGEKLVALVVEKMGGSEGGDGENNEGGDNIEGEENDYKSALKAMLAQEILGIKSPENPDESNGGNESIEGGENVGNESGDLGDNFGENGGEELEVAVA